MAVRSLKQKVELKKIVFDKDLYPRTNYDWRTVYDYKESMVAGAKFPPVTLALSNRKYYLVDGKHRLEALKGLKAKSVNAIIFLGWSRGRIFEEAIRANINHGRAFSPYEKRLLALKLRVLKYPELSVSKLLNIPTGKLESFVGQRLVNSITGEVVTEEVVKSGLKHLAGGTLNDEQVKRVLAAQSGFNMINQVDLLEQVVTLFEEKLLNLKDKKVKELVAQLKSLLKKY